jgi:arabinogalactan oligomer / maltooligosaccharide transport system substrate-binding protein
MSRAGWGWRYETLNAKNFPIAFALFFLALVAACGSTKPTPTAATPPPASPPAAVNTTQPVPSENASPGQLVTPPTGVQTASPTPVAFLLASLGDARSQEAHDVFLQTAQSLTVTVLFNQADGDAAKQKAQVAQALKQGAQVLVIQPVDQDAAAAYVDAAHKAGARVIAFDRLINTRDLDAYVSYDNFHLGQLQASAAVQWLTANKVKTPWNFVLLEGAAGDGVAAEITRGYYDVLKTLIDKKQVVVVADQAHSDWSSAQGSKTTQDALTKTKNNLHAVLANNSALARGALQALDQQNLLGKVFVAGAGTDLENIHALCAGQQNLAVVEDVQPLAVAAAQLAAALAQGQAVADTQLAQGTLTVADKQVPLVRIPVQPVTLDTAQAVLVQSGRFTPDQVGKCFTPLADGATVPTTFSQGNLTLWTQEDDDVYAYLANLAAQFAAANSGVQISLTNFTADALRAQLQNDRPDAIWTTNDQVNDWALSNAVQPTDDWLDATQFLTVTYGAVQVADKHYAVPVSTGNDLLLYYNQKLLKQPPADTNALVKLAPTLTKADGAQWTLVFDESDPATLIPWLGGFKGQVFAADGRTPTLNTTAMTDTLAFLLDLKNKKVIPPDFDSTAADTAFKGGKAAMIVTSDARLNDYSAALGDNLGVAVLPKVSTTREAPHPYVSGKFLFFNQSLSGDKLAIAKAFAQFVTSRAIQLDMTRKFKRLPARRDALSDALIANDPLLKPAADEAQLSLPLPTNPEMRCVWDSLKSNLQPVLSGNTTPADAAKAMQDSAETCIGKQ